MVIGIKIRMEYVTIIPNATTAPNGTMTADKLYPTSSGNY
jgi:hypothetical protein